MAAAGRSLQALCRAAFSLASAASTSAASPAVLTQLGLRGGAAAAAAAGGLGALQQHAAAAAGLRQLARVRLLGFVAAARLAGWWDPAPLPLPPQNLTPPPLPSLHHLPQHLHSSAAARFAEQGGTPAMNPLQQVRAAAGWRPGHVRRVPLPLACWPRRRLVATPRPRISLPPAAHARFEQAPVPLSALPIDSEDFGEGMDKVTSRAVVRGLAISPQARGRRARGRWGSLARWLVGRQCRAAAGRRACTGLASIEQQ